MPRPRIHADNAAKQKAYRLRKYGRPPMSNSESLDIARARYMDIHGKSGRYETIPASRTLDVTKPAEHKVSFSRFNKLSPHIHPNWDTVKINDDKTVTFSTLDVTTPEGTTNGNPNA